MSTQAVHKRQQSFDLVIPYQDLREMVAERYGITLPPSADANVVTDAPSIEIDNGVLKILWTEPWQSVRVERPATAARGDR